MKIGPKIGFLPAIGLAFLLYKVIQFNVEVNRPEVYDPWIQLNVRDYGAKGDGTNDDTVAIQKCIDKLTRSATPGKIFIPDGTYKINRTLIVGQTNKPFSGLTITGPTNPPPWATLKQINARQGGFELCTGLHHVTFSHLNFECAPPLPEPPLELVNYDAAFQVQSGVMPIYFNYCGVENFVKAFDIKE